MNVQPVFGGGKAITSAPRAFQPKLGKPTRPFSQVLHEIVRDPRLQDRDIRLVCLLLEYSKDRAHCWPSVLRLASDLRCSERTVQYALARLTRCGWISTMPDSNPTGRTILLTWRLTGEASKPPVQRVASPPVQTSVGPPVQGAAPELDPRERKKEGRSPQGKQKTEPSPQTKPTQGRAPASTKVQPMDAGEMVATFGDWLSRPAGDSLRLMAERRLASMLGSTKGIPPSSSDRSPTRESSR